MSSVKVPIFGGLVTNADSEDLQKQFTPGTHNFDTSEVGTLRRRDISTKVTHQTDRGFDSMFLFRNQKLTTGSGMEWLIYCSQRGIIFRMDRFYNELLLDSYDDNTLQYNSNNNPPGNDFLYFIPNEQQTVPEFINFQPFGDYVLVGMGHDFIPKIIQAIDARKQFTGQYTKPTGVYIEDFHRGYPETYTVSATATTSLGALSAGTYRYNFVPIYDGVNEIPIDNTKSQEVSVTPANGVASVNLSLINNTDDLPCSLTGYRVYRATIVGNAKPAFRAIKTVNLLTPAGATDQLIESTSCFAGRHIIHSPEGFPSIQEINTLWNSKFPNNQYTITQMTDVVDNDDEFKIDILKMGSQGDSYGSSNTAYTEKTCDRTDATGFFGGSMLQASDINPGTSGFDLSNYGNVRKDADGEFLHLPLRHLYYPNNDDGNIDEDGYGNGWTALTGDTILMRILVLVTGGSGGNAVHQQLFLNIFIRNCYMGKDKIYSHDNIFLAPSTHNNSTARLQYTNKSGTAKDINENIYLHHRKVVMFGLDSNGDPSNDIDALTLDYNATGNNSNNLVQENDITNFSITGSGNVGQSYNSTNKQATITFADKGEADGALPSVPQGTITDLRWLHSENHGGRMFVGNVLLDPSGMNESFPDMINFSEMGMPAIIPIGNFIRIRDPEGGGVQGLKSMGDSLIVFMEYGIYRLRVPSIDPSTYSVLESNEFIGCIAPRSVVKVEDSVYFCGNNNIYSIDAGFNIKSIGSAILDKWIKETEKSKTIAMYDPIKEVVLFRFGRVKPDLYEYNIRTGEWNKIQTQGNVSSMAVGEEGYLHFGDNSFLDITRSDGNDNSQDDADNPDLPDGDDPENPNNDIDENDPDTFADLFDNTFDSTADIMTEHNTNTAFFAGTTFRNLTSSSGSNILTGWNPATGIVASQRISGYGLPSGTTVTSTNASNNNIDVSVNATQDSPVPPGFASYTIEGHDGVNTFFGHKEFNQNSNMFRYHLNTDDFSNSNSKFNSGYFCDEDYLFLRVIADNITMNSLSLTRKLVKCELLRLDLEGFNATPQEFKFSRVHKESEIIAQPIFVYLFQNQFDINVEFGESYSYQSGDFTTWGAGEGLHTESIVVVKWKNSSYTQQNIQLINEGTIALFVPDIYNYRKWVDIKPDPNSDQDEGEESPNYVQPTIQVVNTSTATADANGSGDSDDHFPYWSRLSHHGNEFSFSNDNTYGLLDNHMAISGQPYKIARYMGQIENQVVKFQQNTTYTFEFFHIYQLDENSNGAFQRYRPIKNVAIQEYYGQVAYAMIYRLINIDGADGDEYEPSLQSPYPQQLIAHDFNGFDPMEEEEVELTKYYPSNVVQPEQAIVPVGGWLEMGLEQ